MKHALFASCFLFSSLFGQTLSLDLDETIFRAIRESEDYQIQKNEVVKSDARTRETQSILFPQVTGEVNYITNVNFPDLPTTRCLNKNNLDAGVNVNQIITTFGKISASIAATKEFTYMNMYREESIRDEVIFTAKLLYFNAYFSKRALQILKESYKDVIQNKTILDDRSEMGRLSKRDTIKASADVAARIPMISNAESSYINALESLKKAIGVDPDIEIELIEGYRTDYESFDKQHILAHFENCQPVLKALKKSIEAQEYLVRSKEAEYYPTLSAFARYNYKGSSDDFFIGNNILYNYSAVGLNLQIPLFYGDRTRSRIVQSIVDKDNAILTYQKTRKNLELELEKAITEYNELIKTLPADKEAFDLAQDSFYLSQHLFKSGQLSITDLNDAEMMLTNQKLKNEANLFKLQVNLAKIERLSCLGKIYE